MNIEQERKGLLPCPWCGPNGKVESGEVFGSFGGVLYRQAGCQGCGACGPTAPTEEDANSLWNARASQPLPVEAIDALRRALEMIEQNVLVYSWLGERPNSEAMRAKYLAYAGSIRALLPESKDNG